MRFFATALLAIFVGSAEAVKQTDRSVQYDADSYVIAEQELFDQVDYDASGSLQQALNFLEETYEERGLDISDQMNRISAWFETTAYPRMAGMVQATATDYWNSLEEEFGELLDVCEEGAQCRE